jgi:hypothetical protein
MRSAVFSRITRPLSYSRCDRRSTNPDAPSSRRSIGSLISRSVRVSRGGTIAKIIWTDSRERPECFAPWSPLRIIPAVPSLSTPPMLCERRPKPLQADRRRITDDSLATARLESSYLMRIYGVMERLYKVDRKGDSVCPGCLGPILIAPQF